MHMAGNDYTGLCEKTIANCLFFQLAVVPLLINPFVYEWWYGPKIESTYALVCIILAAAGVLKFAGALCIARAPKPICFFLFLYALFAIVATCCSIDFRLSLRGDFIRHESLATLIVYTLLPILFASLVHSRQQAGTLLLGLAISSIATSGYAIIQYAGLDPIALKPFWGIKMLSGTKAVGSTLGNANFLGKFLVLTAPLLLAYLFMAAKWHKHLLWGMAVLLAMAALIATETRASWFGAFIACSIFFCLVQNSVRFKKKAFFISLATALTGGLIFLAIVALSSGRLSDLQHTMISRTAEVTDMLTGKKAITKSPRFFLWEKGLDQIAQRPLFGYGPDTHVLIMRKYNFEYNSRFDDNVEIDKVHNNYLDVALAQGLCGLFAYCGILVSFLGWLWRALQKEKNAEVQIFLRAIFSGYCGYLVNDFFSFSVVSVSPAFWSLMGLTIALQRIGAGSKDACSEEQGALASAV
jgi:O-antigen ligase